MIELVLLARADQVDALSDALTDELDALAVTVEDADADTPDEAPIFGEPGMPATLSSQIGGWQRSIVKALFTDEDAATEAATLLLAQDDDSGATLFDDLHIHGLQPVADQDWVRLTQSQFEPVLITSDFWIVPSWHKAPEGATRVMRLDPGLAFGTGTHPTTRMCLRWIARHADLSAPWPRVLDYGCGSGILAIGAAKFGAVDIDAVDIDPAAVESTLQNAQANGVQLKAGLPDKAQGEYQTVLANILATPLRVLAPLLCSHVAAGGHLVLAGILERQADELKEAYAPWLPLQVADSEDGWILMTASR